MDNVSEIPISVGLVRQRHRWEMCESTFSAPVKSEFPGIVSVSRYYLQIKYLRSKNIFLALK